MYLIPAASLRLLKIKQIQKSKHLFSKNMDTKLEQQLIRDGFTLKKYSGTSTAREYILKTKAGQYSVVLNYGKGRHAKNTVWDTPYYYKFTGVNMVKTKVIDPTRYQRKHWIKEKNWRIIDGNTGKVLKEAGVILKK